MLRTLHRILYTYVRACKNARKARASSRKH
jgi:hypothetical protein